MKVNKAREEMTKYHQDMEHYQIVMNKNTNTSIKNLEIQVGQLSHQMKVLASSSGGLWVTLLITRRMKH